MTRALAKLEAAGFIMMTATGRPGAPGAAFKKIVIEIDPHPDRDRLQLAQSLSGGRGLDASFYSGYLIIPAILYRAQWIETRR